MASSVIVWVNKGHPGVARAAFTCALYPSHPEFLAEVRRTQGHAGLPAHHSVNSMLAFLELGPMEWPAA